MKTKNIFGRNFFAFAVMTTGLLLIVSCKKDNSDDTNNNNVKTYTVSGSASGSQENPPVTTTGTGSLMGTYNAASNKMDYTITWAGLSGPASIVRLYGPGGMGVNGNVIVDLTITANGVSGTSSGSATLDESTETHLLSGNVYYNILTVANPTGEVRGQVSAVANK